MDEANTAAAPHNEKDLVTFVSLGIFVAPSYPVGRELSNDLLGHRDSQTGIAARQPLVILLSKTGGMLSAPPSCLGEATFNQT